jgi:hypothetical protein
MSAGKRPKTTNPQTTHQRGIPDGGDDDMQTAIPDELIDDLDTNSGVQTDSTTTSTENTEVPKPPRKSYSVSLRSELDEYLDEGKSWRKPSWLERSSQTLAHRKSYREYLLDDVRARYLRIEFDIVTGLRNNYNSPILDITITKRVIVYLQMAREVLENNDCDIDDAGQLLDMVEQNMVYMYPRSTAKARAAGLASKFKRQGNNIWANYVTSEVNRPDQTLTGIRSVLDYSIDQANQEENKYRVSAGLQIRRLEVLRKWSLVALALMLILLPLVIKFEPKDWKDTYLKHFFKKNVKMTTSTIGLNDKNIQSDSLNISSTTASSSDNAGVITTETTDETTDIDEEIVEGERNGRDFIASDSADFTSTPSKSDVPTEMNKPFIRKIKKIKSIETPVESGIERWIVLLSIAILGAAGGFFSGLFQVRGERVALGSYEESMLKFQLKPVVGACLAMLVFMLLGWEVLGVTFENVGSFFFLAFLTGFSERYFFSLLQLKESEVSTSNELYFAKDSTPSSITAPPLSENIVDEAQENLNDGTGIPLK